MPTHIARNKHISTGKRHYGAIVNGLTKKERRELADKLVADGMNAHTARGRILRISGRIHRHTIGEGWREWEILGINRCIIGFCEQDNRAPLPLYSPYEWWGLLCGKDTLRGVKSAFYDYMAARDLSAVRLSRMMEEKSITEWQRKGLAAYIDENENENENK